MRRKEETQALQQQAMRQKTGEGQEEAGHGRVVAGRHGCTQMVITTHTPLRDHIATCRMRM